MPSEQSEAGIDLDAGLVEDAAQLRDGRNLDLMAEAFCTACETTAELDETAIDQDTTWIGDECECGETEVNVRVAPWPRDFQREETDRYVDTGGPFWGAYFRDLCRGHREYVKHDPRPEKTEEIDLHTTPDGEHVGEPVPVTECTLCRESANKHGYGIHTVSIYGCPNCGNDIERLQSRGRGAVVNYNRCYECAPTRMQRLREWLPW